MFLFNRNTASIILCLFLALSMADPAGAEKRIVLIGDSWTQFPWLDGSFQHVLDYNYGTGAYEVEGTYTAIGGTSAEQWAGNFVVPPEYGIPEPPGPGPGGDWGLLDRLGYTLLANPSIDIIHMSLGGIDLLLRWNSLLAEEEKRAIWKDITRNVDKVIRFAKRVRPGIKVLWVGYDYLNITENCTYAHGPLWDPHYFTEFSWVAVQFALFYGFEVDLFNAYPNRANNEVMNRAFGDCALYKIAFALNTDGVDYIDNFGINQFRGGYENSMGVFWGSYEVPPPGAAPDYEPLLGGNPNCGTPPVLMNRDGDEVDPIHLNRQGYIHLFDNCIAQYYHWWLTGKSGESGRHGTGNAR